jgi:hypothetical protein
MPGTTPTNQPVAPAGGFQQGGWYNGQQYWNGTFSAPGVINSQSNQPGAGQAVNPLVVAATNAQQGLAPGTNEAYIAQQTANPTNPVTSGVLGGTAAPGATGGVTGGATSAVEDVFNTPEIQAANSAITERQTALATAQLGINDNPFYSEATRVGKLASLQEKYLADIAPYQTQLTQLQDIAKTKYAAQQTAAQTSTQTFTDNAGNVTAVTMDKAGNIVKQTNVGKVGAADKATGTTPKATDYVTWAKTDAAAGKTLDDLMSYYSGYLTKQEIWDLYMATNYYKNTPTQIAEAKKKWDISSSNTTTGFQ